MRSIAFPSTAPAERFWRRPTSLEGRFTPGFTTGSKWEMPSRESGRPRATLLSAGVAIQSSRRARFTNFEPGAYNGYEVDQGGTTVPYDAPSGTDNNFNVNLGLTTPTWQALDAFVQVIRARGAIFAEGAEGYETRVVGTLDLRPTGSIRVSGSNTYSLITRSRDGSEFARTIIPRLKVEYQPTRPLFFRVVGSTSPSDGPRWRTPSPEIPC